MKKLLIGVSAVIVLAVLFLVGQSSSVSMADREVSVQETVLEGDPTVADGLRVYFSMNYDNHLYWDIGHERNSTDEVDFSYHSLRREKVRDGGVKMSVFGFNSDSRDELIKKAVKKKKENEMNVYSVGVDPIDFYEHYPIEFSLDIPECKPGSDFELMMSGAFTVPVDPGLHYHFKLSNSILDKSMESSDHAESSDLLFDCTSAVTEDGCYFVFSSTPDEGEFGGYLPLDLTKLPMGYGIYFLPIRENVADASGLEMVYPLDPQETTLVRLCAVSGGEKLLLFTRNTKNEYTCTMLDTETMIAEDSFFVWDATGTTIDYFEHGDNFAALVFLDDHVAVVAENADGSYSLQYVLSDVPGERIRFDQEAGTYSTNDVGVNWLYNAIGSGTMAWKDGKLAIAYSGSESYDYYVAIHDESGRLYWGGYTTSLNGTPSVYKDYDYKMRTEWY